MWRSFFCAVRTDVRASTPLIHEGISVMPNPQPPSFSLEKITFRSFPPILPSAGRAPLCSGKVSPSRVYVQPSYWLPFDCLLSSRFVQADFLDALFCAQQSPPFFPSFGREFLQSVPRTQTRVPSFSFFFKNSPPPPPLSDILS